MTVVLCVIAYVVIAGITVFGLMVAGAMYVKYDVDEAIWVISGIFWPIAALPAVGYIAATWFIDHGGEQR